MELTRAVGEAEQKVPRECKVALKRQFGTYCGMCRGCEQSVDFQFIVACVRVWGRRFEFFCGVCGVCRQERWGMGGESKRTVKE